MPAHCAAAAKQKPCVLHCAQQGPAAWLPGQHHNSLPHGLQSACGAARSAAVFSDAGAVFCQEYSTWPPAVSRAASVSTVCAVSCGGAPPASSTAAGRLRGGRRGSLGFSANSSSLYTVAAAAAADPSAAPAVCAVLPDCAEVRAQALACSAAT